MTGSMPLGDDFVVWVVTLGLDRRNGTERCTVEELARWSARFQLRVFAHAVSDDVDPDLVDQVPALPAPHLARYWSWFVTNHFARALARRRLEPPAVVHSPGVNCLDADAIGVHMMFWRHPALSGARHVVNVSSSARALHQWLYARSVQAMERRVYAGPAMLWACSQRDATDLERGFSR